MNIEIKFKEEYKSIPKGQEFIFKKNLIVISGKNGTGKSHLLEGVKNGKCEICIVKDEEEEKVEISSIFFKNLNDLLSSGGNAKISIADPNYINSLFGLILNELKNLRDPRRNSNFTSAIHQISKTIPIYSVSTLEDLKKKLENFEFEELVKIWQPDDIFSAVNVSNLFLTYCQKKTKEASDDNHKNYDDVIDESAPWKIFNKAFKDLDFKYRFAERYSEDYANLKPDLRLLCEEKEVSFDIGDLSSGEKIIFGLILASYRSSLEKKDIKILLLDEIDAPLNPTLLEKYLNILRDYFLEKGVIVILTTHSPILLAMANKKEESSFYEIFNSGEGERYKESGTGSNYEEVKIAFKDLHEKIKSGQKYEKRLQDMEKEIKKIKEPNIVFVEGKNDYEIFNLAWDKLKTENEEKNFNIIENEEGDNAYWVKIRLEYFNCKKGKGEFEDKNFFGIFDCDDEGIMHSKTGKVKIPGSILLPVENEILKNQVFEEDKSFFTKKVCFKIEHMFYRIDKNFDENFFEEKKCSGGGRIIDIKGNNKNTTKNNILKEIKTKDKDFFKNFKEIIEKIN